MSIDDDYDKKDDAAEGRTCAAREKQRAKLQAEVEAFLASGGKIQHLDSHQSAELASRSSDGEAAAQSF